MKVSWEMGVVGRWGWKVGCVDYFLIRSQLAYMEGSGCSKYLSLDIIDCSMETLSFIRCDFELTR